MSKMSYEERYPCGMVVSVYAESMLLGGNFADEYEALRKGGCPVHGKRCKR